MKKLAACLVLSVFAISLGTSGILADGPRDNIPENVRRVPRLGVEVPDEKQTALNEGLQKLEAMVGELSELKSARIQALLPDVEIFARAVDCALKYQEFFSKGDINKAEELLIAGLKRAEQLLDGKAPWTTATGLVVRGYVSKIDHTVQPYGLVIPESYTPVGTDRFRCDLWFHGRGETLSEVNFIYGRMNQVGQYAPKDSFVLHPYGRYSNAFKFAGEVDVIEALEDAKQRYRIDEDRIASRGFSMGGAACWQFAVHYSDRWFAANPGAGFSETPEFLKFFQKETLNPTWYEKKLWHMYDCTDVAVNLFNCPTVAYSGEDDIQKQAADIMESALAKEEIDMIHIIGPETGHRIHPDSKVVISDLLSSIAERGRIRVPKTVHFATYTLKYNRMNWVTVDAMGEHWEQARVDAAILADDRLELKTKNVTELTLSMPAGWCPLDMIKPIQLKIDHQPFVAPKPKSDRSWVCRLHKVGDRWRLGAAVAKGLKKRHNLQGPIDDAFMDSFIIVEPTGKSESSLVQKWTTSEQEHAIEHWRRHFRGDARVSEDNAITDEDIASANLVLFGDPSSNSILAKIADKLPIEWSGKSIVAGEKSFDAENHVLIGIYPNPLNPNRYVVLNSGFTYREFAYLNNARQVPMLPDWAIVDVRSPVTSQYPGKIVAADFFDEKWELRPPRE